LEFQEGSLFDNLSLVCCFVTKEKSSLHSEKHLEVKSKEKPSW
jgi:hypothetical protein